MADLKHSDCKNFAPVDVAKGICRLKNELIFIDSPICKKFATLPKCKNCDKFVPEKDNMGCCKGFNDGYWAYEDNIAVTCEEYIAK